MTALDVIHPFPVRPPTRPKIPHLLGPRLTRDKWSTMTTTYLPQETIRSISLLGKGGGASGYGGGFEGDKVESMQEAGGRREERISVYPKALLMHALILALSCLSMLAMLLRE